MSSDGRPAAVTSARPASTADPARARPASTADPARPRAVATLPVLLVVAVAAALVLAAGVAGLGVAAPPAGLRDGGPLTRWGVPLARLAQDLAAVGTVGTLLAAAVLLPAGADGRLPPAARRLLALSVRWTLWWLGAAVASLLLGYSDTLALPVWKVFSRRSPGEVYALAPCRALLVVVLLTALLAAAAPAARTRTGAAALLLLGLGALLPPLLAGHAVHGGQKGLTAVALVLHVACAALWAGGLVAVGLHLRSERGLLPVVGERLSRVALPCSALLVASGLTTAISRGAGPDALLSGYGRLLAAKAVLVLLLLALGGWHRLRTLRLLRRGLPDAFLVTCCSEVLLLTGAVTLAAVLARTASS